MAGKFTFRANRTKKSPQPSTRDVESEPTVPLLLSRSSFRGHHAGRSPGGEKAPPSILDSVGRAPFAFLTAENWHAGARVREKAGRHREGEIRGADAQHVHVVIDPAPAPAGADAAAPGRRAEPRARDDLEPVMPRWNPYYCPETEEKAWFLTEFLRVTLDADYLKRPSAEDLVREFEALVARLRDRKAAELSEKDISQPSFQCPI